MWVGACREALEFQVFVSSLMWSSEGQQVLSTSGPPLHSPGPSAFAFTASRPFLLGMHLTLDCGALWLLSVSPPRLHIL